VIENSNRLAVAIDIGGTRLKAALIRGDGTLVDLVRQTTPASADPGEVVTLLSALIEKLCAKNHVELDQLLGVGISIAAFIQADGLVTATAHLSPHWVGFNLDTALRSKLNTVFYFALDTPAPTLGEAYFGAGKGSDFVYVTVSTGIGAGIIADGRYFTGGMGWAGGVGHIILDEHSSRICEGCGNAGCLETFAATQGILTTAREVLEEEPVSILHDWLKESGKTLSPALIHEAAEAGDQAAIQIWDKVGHALGLGLVNLIDIVAPSRVVIGGGIAQAGEFLLSPARKVVQERAFPPSLRKVEIIQAALGDLSGVYGAAALVFFDLNINA
jgi:predicted NBD/HSP70 family sugar kinase